MPRVVEFCRQTLILLVGQFFKLTHYLTLSILHSQQIQNQRCGTNRMALL